MEPDEPRVSPPPSRGSESAASPTDAELSRIAREAVRQPADPRLDKQLARMGLTDDPAPVAVPPASGRNVETLELESRLRLLQTIVWLLVVAVVILSAALIILLIR
jgi:hypothetical protein